MTVLPPTPKGVVSHAGSFWLPKLKTGLLFAIFFLSSTQLGLHFWPASSILYGVRVDYLSPTLYFLDLLIFLYLCINPIALIRNTKYIIQILPLLLVSLLFSLNPLATLSWSLHLSLYLVFLSSLTQAFFLRTIYYILPLTAIFQIILALIQVVLGHSIGGGLYYLGERMVSTGSPNVALATFANHVVLRAYATFGHPNVLAGWLVICLLIFLTLRPKLHTTYYVLYTVLVALGVLLTQSRSAALTLFGIIIPFSLLRSFKQKLIYFPLLLIAICYMLTTTSTLARQLDLSSNERLDLQQVSLQIIQKYPFFGTGANASLTSYPTLTSPPRLLQPDHNSFTLILSWFGIFGVLALIYTLPRTSSANAREKCLQTLRSLGGLLPLLFLDHYLLTSPQGMFILLLYAKVVHYSHVKEHS